MEIIKSTINEIKQVVNLAIQLWPDNDINELTEEVKASIQDENNAFFLAYSKNGAIGFAHCALRHDYVEGTESSPIGYLEGIFVCKEYRNKGVGTRLIDACEEWARTKGCTEFASDCELSNIDSLKFHIKAGFKEANRIICFTKSLLKN